jgi:hypothetical protein
MGVAVSNAKFAKPKANNVSTFTKKLSHNIRGCYYDPNSTALFMGYVAGIFA